MFKTANYSVNNMPISKYLYWSLRLCHHFIESVQITNQQINLTYIFAICPCINCYENLMYKYTNEEIYRLRLVKLRID